MAAAKAKKGAAADDFENSILARLTAEQQQRSVDEEFANDVTILFCGGKRSGKTSLVDRFISPTKDEKDIPKPTVALDYKFARYAAEASTSKVLAHIYDLGGDESNDGLVGTSVSKATVGNLVLAVVVDLSTPHNVLPTLEKWLALLREQAHKSFQTLAQESMTGAKRVEAIQQVRIAPYAEHPDAAHLNVFPVPLVIFGTKWDSLASDVDPDKRKSVCRAMRHFAHVNGASLVMTSLKDKTSMSGFRGILRQLLFGVTDKKGALPEQLDPSKPISVPAGKDSLQGIGAPSGNGMSTDAAWRGLMADFFPDPHLRSKDPKKSDTEQVAEELLKYPESGIDGMVEQRMEELQQYRRQVERNQRLASEGVDGRKEIAA